MNSTTMEGPHRDTPSRVYPGSFGYNSIIIVARCPSYDLTLLEWQPIVSFSALAFIGVGKGLPI